MNNLSHISKLSMLTAGPILDLIDAMREELNEARELAPGSPIILTLARLVKRLETAVETAAMETATCDTETAAELMDVSPRQATKLAKQGRVKASQSSDGCRWTFDARSCHAYAASKGRRVA